MFWVTGTFWLSIMLALTVPIILIRILHNRLKSIKGEGHGARGVGCKVLRFTFISIRGPLVAALDLYGSRPFVPSRYSGPHRFFYNAGLNGG